MFSKYVTYVKFTQVIEEAFNKFLLYKIVNIFRCILRYLKLAFCLNLFTKQYKNINSFLLIS